LLRLEVLGLIALPKRKVDNGGSREREELASKLAQWGMTIPWQRQ